MKHIKFDKLSSALGRNGNIAMSGATIYSTGYEIVIIPITSKGNEATSCFISIPRENIADVMHAMAELCSGIKVVSEHDSVKKETVL